MTTNPLSPDELVERVARAISEAGYSIGPLESEHCARAAIAAMPELTALQQRVKQLEELLDCAIDEHDQHFGKRIKADDPHWSVQARSLLSDKGDGGAT